MLSDNNINALQNMLKQQYPDVNDLQDPLLKASTAIESNQRDSFCASVIQ